MAECHPLHAVPALWGSPSLDASPHLALCVGAGYVGTFEDQKRIRRQEAEREEQKRQHEEAKRKAAAGAGLRTFGAGTSEVGSSAGSGCGRAGQAGATSPCAAGCGGGEDT